MKLDRLDMRIVECLRRDGRISNQDLAAQVSLSPSACLRRVKLLEEAGIIQGYGCVLDYAKLGLEVEAVVHVSMRHEVEGWHEAFVAAIKDWPEVLSARIVTGGANYMLVVRARDVSHYSDFIVNRLYRAPGVRDIESNIVLGYIKRSASPFEVLDRE
ncbi:Lrp/AsnC family transcriptional regulator [Pigmentiphaga sp. CHJ604]|uniref:Lrp/AsnC family transcriptional regulator n=1 Tax=Pigmentiphaga sp. CHJ604 TaxID=3081984 RepID=UPI0030CF4B81